MSLHEESRPVLDYLYAHASKPEFSCRVQWREGSLGLWDSRATWHLALNDYPGPPPAHAPGDDRGGAAVSA